MGMTKPQARKILAHLQPKPTLQQRLKRVRVETGFSQEGFARVIKVSTASYKMYETGKRDIPLASVLRILEIYSFAGTGPNLLSLKMSCKQLTYFSHRARADIWGLQK